MQTKRTYKFVLTELAQDEEAHPTEFSGKEIYQSACHYYTEKELIEQLKDAEKRGGKALDWFNGRRYAIYKRDKPQAEGCKRKVMLIETIVVKGRIVNIE